MEIRYKRLNEYAKPISYLTDGAACFDLVATSKTEQEQYIQYGTGIAIEIPVGYVGLLLPRSSITNYDLMLKNSVGIIDSDYRGEVMFRFAKLNSVSNQYNIGERIGQMMIIEAKKYELLEVYELSSTDRGQGGFGSTGK